MERVSLTVLCILLAAGMAPVQGSSSFVYLSDHRIVTLEVVDASNLILNYINLSDSFEMIEAPMIALIDSSGEGFNGHLISLDEGDDPTKRYAISDLMTPGEFGGYLIVGDFRTKGSFDRALVQVSSRVLELEPLDSEQFELLAARIGELDLAAEDRKWAIERAGFSRGFGSLYFSGSAEARELESYFPQGDILAPVTLANPSPRLPTSEATRPDPVMVKVRAVVSRQGGLRDVELAEGISPKLDEIAVETVRNSWVFLPAISNNEIVEAEVTLNVFFRRQ